MCGRYTLTAPTESLRELFDVVEIDNVAPRYNIAPTQNVPVVRAAPVGGRREWSNLRWGLVPFFAKDLAVGNRMINARGETVATLPSFRAAFKRRRCLIAADGFYEWQKLEDKKQPFHITVKDGGPFGIAGIWERWTGPDGAVVESTAIITTSANETMAPIHDRMPVILDRADHPLWLDPKMEDKERLLDLVKPCPASWLATRPVSTRVNNPRFDDPMCLA